MENLYYRIYYLPFGRTIFLLVLLGIIWYYLEIKLLRGQSRRRGAFRRLCWAVLGLWLCAVLCATLFSREAGVRSVQWVPFYRLELLLRTRNDEIFRMAWMNLLLFVPGGMLLDRVLPARWPGRRRLGLTVLALAGLSIGIEAAQWTWALGCAETDDVLCNTLGGALGALLREGAAFRARRQAARH